MLFNKKRIFKRRGELERKNLMAFNNISVQSRWVKDHIHFLNPNANIYDTNILLRDAFYEAKPWTYKKVKDFPIIFSSCSAAASYKGLHILIKALYVLKKKYSNIQLHLAGNMDVGVRLLDGYSIFLHHLIHKYGLESNVIFLGPLDDVQLTDKLQKCNVCVVPSFVESYCLGFAESMIMGVPTVASFAGAMPNIADDGKEALFYNSIDYVTCASKIDELLRSRQLSEYLSANARKRRLVENNKEKVVGNQLSIYKSLLEDDV
jgi:glycosyltransferase involved in cell wall biosynthesis